MTKHRFVLLLLACACALTVTVPGSAQETKGQPKAGRETPAADQAPTGFARAVGEELLKLGGREEVTLAGRVVRGVALVVLGWLLYRAAALALRRVEVRAKRVATPSRVQTRRQQHVSTVVDLARSICRYAIIVTTGILLLDWSFGVNVIPIVTGAGILGLAIAFGSQALVRDMVTGMFQLLEGQYAVGDYVQIGAAFGKVEDVGLRVTRLRDAQDRLHFIPNGTISMVTTYEDPFTDYVLQAPIQERERAGDALEAVQALAADLHSEFPELIGYTDEPEAVASEGGLTLIKMRFGVAPTQDWLAAGEVPARVTQLLSMREIASPEGWAPSCYLCTAPRLVGAR